MTTYVLVWDRRGGVLLTLSGYAPSLAAQAEARRAGLEALYAGEDTIEVVALRASGLDALSHTHGRYNLTR